MGGCTVDTLHLKQSTGTGIRSCVLLARAVPHPLPAPAAAPVLGGRLVPGSSALTARQTPHQRHAHTSAGNRRPGYRRSARHRCFSTQGLSIEAALPDNHQIGTAYGFSQPDQFSQHLHAGTDQKSLKRHGDRIFDLRSASLLTAHASSSFLIFRCMLFCLLLECLTIFRKTMSGIRLVDLFNQTSCRCGGYIPAPRS